jgi:hypothetical protein
MKIAADWCIKSSIFIGATRVADADPAKTQASPIASIEISTVLDLIVAWDCALAVMGAIDRRECNIDGSSLVSALIASNARVCQASAASLLRPFLL